MTKAPVGAWRAIARPRLQGFEEKSDATQVAARLKALRAEMAEAGVDAFLVPRADEFQGESVPAGSARLAWLTGFTGSAGMAVVGTRHAALLVDSRYILQAPAQTDTRRIEVLETPPARLCDWIMGKLSEGGVVGYDPMLMTASDLKGLSECLKGRQLRPVDNLIDHIWRENRPPRPSGPIEFLGLNRTGKPAAVKIRELQDSLRKDRLHASVVTLPESACWLLNIRGRDVPNTPLVLGFMIVPRTGKPTLFVARERITAETQQQIAPFARLADLARLNDSLARLGRNGSRVAIDPQNCPAAIAETLRAAGAELVEQRDAILLRKSRKSEAELAGMREAHRLDGIAMARFLAWFDAEAPKGGLTEIMIVERLEDFRREEETLVDISFETISGAGPDGAIVHYRVTEKTNRTLMPGELMLVDSGGQYLSGTTDVTRTLFTGAATSEQKDRYTRVLKGMIGISMLKFPLGTTGAQIDVIARYHLWQAGVTYSHGTGHGVGAYLGVHEGPVGISPRYNVPFAAGNVISNEPGYYKTGEYGIRIENLIHVVERAHPGFLEFETLTHVPIDTRLIDLALLTTGERAWLNEYHARVFEQIAPSLDASARAWLEQATRSV